MYFKHLQGMKVDKKCSNYLYDCTNTRLYTIRYDTMYDVFALLYLSRVD